MKKIIKKWILSPGLLELSKEVYTVGREFLRKRNSLIKKNESFKNIAKGKKCFILGNGPSINSIDLDCLKDEDLIVMSSFYLHKDYKKIDPKYHVVVKVYDNLIPIEDQNNWYKDMENKIKCDAIFFNADQYEIIKKGNFFKKFNLNFVSTANRSKRKFDITKITKHHRTGPLKCMEIAMYMGYSEIYLLGVELDTFCAKEYSYFFDRTNMKTKDKNIKSDDNVKAKMTELLYNNWLTYKDFDEIANFASENNIKVFNLSEISKLDMFDRVSMETVLK
jgi:hypothetical protein